MVHFPSSAPERVPLDFYDLDYEGEKPESEKDLSANLMLMNTHEHYGLTDIEWDPTGRYVVSAASVWHHSVSTSATIMDCFTLITRRWKMAITFIHFQACCLQTCQLRNSSNCFGDPVHQRCYPRKNSARFEGTYVSIAKSLTS